MKYRVISEFSLRRGGKRLRLEAGAIVELTEYEAGQALKARVVAVAGAHERPTPAKPVAASPPPPDQLEETTPEEDSDDGLDELSYEELKTAGHERGLKFAGNIGSVKLRALIRQHDAKL